MGMKDVVLFAGLLGLLGGLGYLVFYSNWRPTPNYTGAPPNYGQKPKNVQVEAVDKDDPRLKYQNERVRNGGR